MFGGDLTNGYWALPLPESTLGHAHKAPEVVSALGALLLTMCLLASLGALWWAWRRYGVLRTK